MCVRQMLYLSEYSEVDVWTHTDTSFFVFSLNSLWWRYVFRHYGLSEKPELIDLKNYGFNC